MEFTFEADYRYLVHPFPPISSEITKNSEVGSQAAQLLSQVLNEWPHPHCNVFSWSGKCLTAGSPCSFISVVITGPCNISSKMGVTGQFLHERILTAMMKECTYM